MLSLSSRCCLTRCRFRGTRKWGHQPAINYVQLREADDSICTSHSDGINADKEGGTVIHA